ncbi:hypothetical protein V1509DRAFT_565060 [Lipomyces kononenkoae]
MELNGIIIPSRFSGVRRSPMLFTSDNFYDDDDDLPCDRLLGDLQEMRTDNAPCVGLVEDKRSRKEDRKTIRGRTYRRNQSDQISNYKLKSTRQSSEFCDTLDVMRIRDNKLFVIKTIPKKRLAEAKASSCLALSVEYFADTLHSLSNGDVAGNRMPRALLPRRAFEDSVAVYFVFDYYDTILAEAMSSAEMDRLYLEAEGLIKGLGYRAATKIVKLDDGQICFIVEIGTVQKVDKETLRNLNGNNFKTVYNPKNEGMGLGPLLQHYWMDMSNIPHTLTSTSQCRMEACDGRIYLYFYGDGQHFEVVSAVDNGIRVKIWTKHDQAAEVYALADLPLHHLARYRYARRLVTCIRRHSVCVAVNAGTRRARLYADGRFEVTGKSRTGITRAITDNSRLRAQCERLLRDAR